MTVFWDTVFKCGEFLSITFLAGMALTYFVMIILGGTFFLYWLAGTHPGQSFVSRAAQLFRSNYQDDLSNECSFIGSILRLSLRMSYWCIGITIVGGLIAGIGAYELKFNDVQKLLHKTNS